MSPTKRKNWFRLLAVFLGLLPVAGLEIAFRFAERTENQAPRLDLSRLEPLFEEQEPGLFSIPERRLDLFRPVAFEMPKRGQFRIFALGGSTTQGEPYSTETAFPQFAGLYLSAANAGQTVEVINCGGLSYASYRVSAILQEIMQYSPDLIIVYSGHNEYLERRSYLMPKKKPIFHSRIAERISRLIGKPQSENIKSMDRIKEEVDALLDYRGGLEDYRRDASWQEGVVEHYRVNLAAMVDACLERDIPLILVRPACNLVDSPPFKTELSPRLNDQQRKQFEELWKQAVEATEAETALQRIEDALAIDPEHAGVLFLQGKLLVELGEFDAAKQALIAAKDFDVCPLRMSSQLLDVFDEVANTRGVPVVDAQEVFDGQSPMDLTGKLQMVDHIHPTVEGHKLLGELIGAKIIENQLFESMPGEQANLVRRRFEEMCGTHLQSLNPAYYERAQQRLAGLRLWTQGRAKKLKLEAE